MYSTYIIQTFDTLYSIPTKTKVLKAKHLGSTRMAVGPKMIIDNLGNLSGIIHLAGNFYKSKQL